VPGQNGALRSGAVGDREPKEGLTPFREAVDPVCGMTVAVGPDAPTAGEHVFCCDGCREAWLARAG
jgi:hypothetical protein